MTIVKFIVALVGSAALWVATYIASGGTMTTLAWIQLSIQVTGAVGVWVAANLPTFPYAKTIVAAIIAVLQLVVTMLATHSHLTHGDIAALIVTALTTLGVYAFPNNPPVTPTMTTTPAI